MVTSPAAQPTIHHQLIMPNTETIAPRTKMLEKTNAQNTSANRLDLPPDGNQYSNSQFDTANPPSLRSPRLRVRPVPIRYSDCNRPPSTGRLIPLMYPAAGEHRNAIAAPNSSGVPNRPAGIVPFSSFST